MANLILVQRAVGAGGNGQAILRGDGGTGGTGPPTEGCRPRPICLPQYPDAILIRLNVVPAHTLFKT